MNALTEALLIVLLGGLFGWTLGKMPDRWVYAVAAGTILLGLVVLTRG